MNVGEVFQFMNGESLALVATVAENGQPEAALIFDTVNSSRKYPNLKRNPRVAWVVGCTTEVTVQYEGIAEELEDEQCVRYKRPYFAKFPDGPARESWPGIILSCDLSGCAIATTIRRHGELRK